MVAPNARAGPTRVQSVERAARLLMIIASAPEHERTVKHLVGKMGTSVPTMYHLLNTLVDARLLTRDRRRQYHLGVAVSHLAESYYRQSQPPLELVEPLRMITEATGESAYLSGWRHGGLEILAESSGTHAVRVMDLKPGFHRAAHARASGKVLLAFATVEERERYLAIHPLDRLTDKTITQPQDLLAELEGICSAGYAREEEEFCDGVACLSVPIIDDGFLVGAYTVSAPIERYRMFKEAYLKELIMAAKQVGTTGELRASDIAGRIEIDETEGR